jgi:hypothetical protein
MEYEPNWGLYTEHSDEVSDDSDVYTEVPHSNLSLETKHPDTCFQGLFQFLKSNVGNVSHLSHEYFSLMSLSIHHS